MKSPRFRYSLKSLLRVMSIVAVITGGCSWWHRSAENQLRAIETISAKGGTVWLDRANGHIEIEFGSSTHEVCGQTVMLGTPLIGSFTHPYPSFSDADLPLIDHIWRVRKVDFESTQVSPAAIQRFRSRHLGCTVIP
jgi:hypothetical protein